MREFSKAIKGEMGKEFCQENFDKICEHLESGNAVWLFCWRTGHKQYLLKLDEKYGERLKRGIYDGLLDCYFLQ